MSFNPEDSNYYPIENIPCGYCWNCRAFNAQQWTARMMHEAELYDKSSFITLTYNNANLPQGDKIPGGTLVKKDLQDFIKRLRANNPELKFKYYQIGEYGGKKGRAHYHAILFGVDFKDKEYWKKTPKGSKLYTSKTLEQSWTSGFSFIGEVTYASIAYCARYAMKKIYGEPAEKHYQGKLPEFTTMSLKPSIGMDWYDIHKHKIFSDGYITLNNRKISIPLFYQRRYSEEHPDEFKKFKTFQKEKYKIQTS